MKTTYETVVIGSGNHASIEIPDKNLAELKANKRAPLKVTINGYTYQSTATGVDGQCRVVLPMRDRDAAGVVAGDRITVNLELDDGYRLVDVPLALSDTLARNGLTETFHNLNYSRRKEYARQISDAKTDETRIRRLNKIVDELK